MWQSAVFAAFAERYQIFAAGAHPLVGVAAREGEGGVREGRKGWRRKEKRRKKRGRKLEVKAKCFKCNRAQ